MTTLEHADPRRNRPEHSPPRSGCRLLGYVAFFAIGLIELRFQWHLLFDLDRSGMVQYYFESLLAIPPLAVVGCFCAVRSRDPVLRVLAVATACSWRCCRSWANSSTRRSACATSSMDSIDATA